MVPKVFLTEPIPHYEILVDLLREYAETKVSDIFPKIVPPESLKGCIAVVVGDSIIDAESLKYADELKLVQKFGAGINTIDIKACDSRGIYVCNIPGVNALDVAEYVIGAMISSLRGFLRMDEAARRAAWDERPALIGERLSNKTVGIIGLGRIGCEVTRLLKPFKGIKILAYDPYVAPSLAESLGVKMVDLKTLLEESDIVTIHVPLSEETKGLICERELNYMKTSAVLINTARGQIVEEKALYQALKNGRIKYAVIDVWAEEPLKPGNPIFELRNVQLSIHTASWTHQFFEEAMKLCAENVIRVVKGEKPLNIVSASI
ncbi:MAG: NAD(P)-dependent oxidoreductase [Candidatus Bathyarchaeia archaeon]